MEDSPLLNGLLRHLPAGVCVLDSASRKYVLQTDRLKTIFGRTLEDKVTLPLLCMDGTPVTSSACPLRRALDEGEVVQEAAYQTHCPGDGRRVLRVTAAPLRDATGNIVSAMAICLDVTLESRARDLERQLIGIVGHDIRNPLAAISIALSVLVKQPALSKPILESVHRAKRGVGRIQRIIGDLLDFTAIRLGSGLPVHAKTTDLARLAREMVDDFQNLEPTRTWVLSCEGNCIGEWDSDRLEQVLSNLLGNAVQHSPPATAIRVGLVALANGRVSLSVHNEGSLIAPQLMPVLFEPLRRGAAETEGKQRNIGMGLYIAKAVVDAHRGRIYVDSAEGEGTTFRVELPRDPLEPTTSPEAQA